MTREELVKNITKKKSFLCVGLDTDITKIPKHLLSCEDPVFEFNKQIIDATKEYCVAYKPNTAFYETNGSKGWQSLEKTINYINQNCKDIFTIADAKRGDIGNTSKMYAKAFFETLNFDSVTVAPYMGEDSVTPFLEYKDKWVILLALTSNKGAFDFQTINLRKFNKPTDLSFLFEAVVQRSMKWGNTENMMFVVGANKAELFSDIRAIAPDHFLLVPGVGAQGGSLRDVSEYGMNADCGILVNSSRAIIYADSSERFAERARKETMSLQKEMDIMLDKFCY